VLGTTWLVARREAGALFGTPTAYVVLALFQLVNGLFFCAIVHSGSAANLAYLYRNVALVTLLMVPALAMGSFVTEKRSGTIELLLTAPLSAGQLVMGKFLAYGGFVLVMVGTTLQYPALLSAFTIVDGGRVAAGTLGLAVLGSTMLAVGFLCSSLARHQVSACSSAFVIGLVMWCARSLAGLFVGGPPETLRSFSFFERMVPFTVGLVDTGDVAFFVLFGAVALGLTVRVVQSWRWR